MGLNGQQEQQTLPDADRSEGARGAKPPEPQSTQQGALWGHRDGRVASTSTKCLCWGQGLREATGANDIPTIPAAIQGQEREQHVHVCVFRGTLQPPGGGWGRMRKWGAGVAKADRKQREVTGRDLGCG